MVLKKAGRKPKRNFVEEIDAAIALLSRVRSLAVAACKSDESKRSNKIQGQKPKERALSPEGREAIAAAQRKRWAKIKRQKRQANNAR
jgi:hypothetical protein